MIQLKKQATRLKSQRFLQNNRLVLFFHYNLNKNSKKSTGVYTQAGKHQSLQEIRTKLWFLGGESSTKKHTLQRKAVVLKNRIAQAEIKFASKQQGALFQGPSTLLGIKDVSQLHELLKLYKQQDTLVLLGGIYNNQAISDIQVQKLDKLNKEKQRLDLKLISCGQNPILENLSSMSYHAFFLPCILSKSKHRLIEIFNWRISQFFLFNTEKKV